MPWPNWPGEDAVDAAEMRGLIRIVADDGQINVRFSHPLFGEAVRRRVGTASARKLRGRIAKILHERNLDSPASRIKLAELAIESDHGTGHRTADRGRQGRGVPVQPPARREAGPGGLRPRRWPERSRAAVPRAVVAGPPGPGRQPSSSSSPLPTSTRWSSCSGAFPGCPTLFWSMGDVARADQVLGAPAGAGHPSHPES